jgi:hypothetical protein
VTLFSITPVVWTIAIALSALPSCSQDAPLANKAVKEISSYPFHATPEREARIRGKYRRVANGMSPVEVTAILGEPDEIRPLYSPRIKNGKVIGTTYWFVIRRLVRNGSADEKQESLVRVSFGLDDKVQGIDAWGF